MSASAFRVRMLDAVASTNIEVKRAIEAGEPEGLVVRARRQTGGYGRQGRAWASPEGGLYCSLLLRPGVAPAILPTLGLVVGLAVRRAVVKVVGSHAAESVLVKWPNDVVVARGAPYDETGVVSLAKLCGISCEAHGGGVCVGVGVNVLPLAGSVDVGGKNQPVYVADLAGRFVSVDLVFKAFLDAFESMYGEWLNRGFFPFVEEFDSHAALTGRAVRMMDVQGNLLASGEVVRVDRSGFLVLRDSEGSEVVVASGEAHIAQIEI